MSETLLHGGTTLEVMQGGKGSGDPGLEIILPSVVVYMCISRPSCTKQDTTIMKSELYLLIFIRNERMQYENKKYSLKKRAFWIDREEKREGKYYTRIPMKNLLEEN